MATWLLIDGFNIIFRSFYAIPPELKSADGFPTNAIHGWVRTLWYLEDNQKPDATAAFFDLGGDVRREALLPDYKANRSECPPDLGPQIPVIKELAAAMGYVCVEQNGVEADDVLGAWAGHLADRGDTAKIVSADKDLGQCVRVGVTQLLPPPTANPRLGWRELDAEAIAAKFGVGPELIPDFLALVGDAVDNIPGLPGVGPKTATKWLQQFGNLEDIIANSGMLKPVRFQQMLHESRDRIRKNLVMTRLASDIVVDVPPTPAPDLPKLQALFEKLSMKKAAADAARRYGE